MAIAKFNPHHMAPTLSLAMILKAVLFMYAATLPVLAFAVPADLTTIPGTTPVHHFSKRSLIALDEDWCRGKVHVSEGNFKPRAAICVWNDGPGYKVLCSPANASPGSMDGYWIDGACDAGLACKQLDDVRIWTGLLALDVDCVPTSTIVKWAIGARQLGESQAKFCTKAFHYVSSKGVSPVWELFASFYGTTGQITQIHSAQIWWNGNLIQNKVDSNNVATRHTIGRTDTIVYCGVRGSDSLIEGYATAKVVSFPNALNTAANAEGGSGFTVVEAKDQSVLKKIMAEKSK